MRRILKLPPVEIHGSVLCPVKTFNKMCQKVPALPSDPLFFLPKKCITYYQYQTRLIYFIEIIGLNPIHFSSHSLRRGGTRFAFRSKVPVELIKLHGDWKVNAINNICHFHWKINC